MAGACYIVVWYPSSAHPLTPKELRLVEGIGKDHASKKDGHGPNSVSEPGDWPKMM